MKILFVLFLSLKIFATENLDSATWNNSSLKIKAHCSLFDMNGKLIRTFAGGGLCLFFDDGSVVTQDDNKLYKFDKSQKKIWESNIENIHHRISWSNVNQEILVIAAYVKEVKKKKIRFDTINAFNSDGKKLKSLDSRKIIGSLKKALGVSLDDPHDLKFQWLGTNFELVHFNSIVEIPKNKNESKIKAFREGNYIVTSSIPSGIIIIDRNLTKILWAKNFTNRFSGLHDASVTGSGTILYYLNQDGGAQASAVEEWDPIQGKNIWRTNSYSEKIFYSEISGSVDLIKDDIVAFSEVGQAGNEKANVYFLNKNGVALKKVELKDLHDENISLHKLEFGEFESFLKLNKGL